jgi:hypothetical protein
MLFSRNAPNLEECIVSTFRKLAIKGSKPATYCWFLLALFFHPDDAGSMCLQTTGLSQDCMALKQIIFFISTMSSICFSVLFS